MDAIEIFKQIIGERLKPLIIKYDPYKDEFLTHPFRHILDVDFEKKFSDVMFDSVIFYAYEKDEIEGEHRKGKFNNLRQASRRAYEDRVPKTEKTLDGLLGELTLDSFIKLFFPNIEMLYSRVKYLERYPHKEKDMKRSGHEVKGYDGMLFSIEDNQKYIWLGQAKTGDWDYCFYGIKEDINKSILKYYFSDAIAIMCDIMRAANTSSPELYKIIDDINGIIFDCYDRGEKAGKIIEYFKNSKIKVRIPCLLMPDESRYSNDNELLEIIKTKVRDGFKDFIIENDEDIDLELLLLIFPLRNLNKLRDLFLEARRG